MKQLTCEMCGSTDLTKKDGVFICQTCNTKYSVEEAKKMMVEGTVEVQGTVKVDNTSLIENFLKMAESAYESGNKLEAENYCNKIIEIDAGNYSAWFLKGKAAGWQSNLKNLRIQESVSCFLNAIENAPDGFKEKYSQDASNEISELSLSLVDLCCNNYIEFPLDFNEKDIIECTGAVKTYSSTFLEKCGVKSDELESRVAGRINGVAVDVYNKEYSRFLTNRDQVNQYFKISDNSINLLTLAVNYRGLSDKDNIISYKNLIAISSAYARLVLIKDSSRKDKLEASIANYHSKIKELDPNYVIPVKSGGCYVATAVYGSYDCPEVWTLRRFRDDILADNIFGRAFIHTYYAISPTLVKWFGDTNWFKKIWKSKLDHLVLKLEEMGIENTPYEDKRW